MSQPKQIFHLLAGTALTLLLQTLPAQTVPRLNYPPAPRTAQADDYFGTRIADPYRTLENADDPATRQWVERENELTASVLAHAPNRDALSSRLTALWNYERFGTFYKAGPHYFYAHNSGLQNQSVYYVLDSLSGTPRLLLDPNTYRKDGTAAVDNQSVSWDGSLFAYSVAQAGSDWQEWHIRDVSTGRDHPDIVQWCKGGPVSWAGDNSGFYYSRFPEPPARELLTVASLNEKVYFHKLGDPQSADRLIYEIPGKPSWGASVDAAEGGRFLLLYSTSGQPGRNTLAYIDLRDPAHKIIHLIPEEKAAYTVLAVVGATFYVQTTEDAPRGHIVAIDINRPAKSDWKEVVPQATETLDAAQIADGKILLQYMKDAHSTARLVTLEGEAIGDVAMPGLGTAIWSPARLHDKEAFFNFASFVMPTAVYRLDLETGKVSPVRQPKSTFDPARFETKQVFYKSKDGTRVPMFLNFRKGMAPTGANPSILYAYGGFDISITPQFDPAIAAWMEMGGIYAVANLRGGGEYGEAWHEAGMREHKQNVFDDFISAAEWLIANRYTSTPKLAISGGSNGGLLVGAVLNQRPDLFGAAMPAVGVMDMLRFHKFGFGTQWVGEYGTPDKPEDFKIVRAYSPLHNIRPGTKYPATLITTSDHDDRVMPGHSLKYAATLQQAQAGPAPILIRIETRAGHGAGKPVSKRIGEWVDRFAFLEIALGM